MAVHLPPSGFDGDNDQAYTSQHSINYWQSLTISGAYNILGDYNLLHRIHAGSIITNVLISANPADTTLQFSIGILPGDADTNPSAIASVIDGSIVPVMNISAPIANPTSKVLGGATLIRARDLLASLALTSTQKMAFGRSPDTYIIAMKITAAATGTPLIKYNMQTVTS